MLKNKKAEFAALYGRRRVGKTFLVKAFFTSKADMLIVTGLKDGSLKMQLEIFRDAFDLYTKQSIKSEIPTSWKNAFEQLTNYLKQQTKPQIIFFDELPWLATKRSNLLQVLDHFWNVYWSDMPQMKLIVCGSAASWMLDNIIDEKGGLHNRLTRRMRLKPFTLLETEELMKTLGHRHTRSQLLDIYMVSGGVPYYLEHFQKSKSINQNINLMCFNENGLLRNEFVRLYRSLFENSDLYVDIIRSIASKHSGISRNDLLRALNTSSSGYLTKRLSELKAAGFIESFYPYQKKNDEHYHVIDLYSLFYLKWIDPIENAGKQFSKNYWQSVQNTPVWHNWCGYAFENICFSHASQIIHALDLESSCTSYASLYVPGSKQQKGFQIDLLLERNDGAVTICEMKFSHKKYKLDKESAFKLSQKMLAFRSFIPDETEQFLALVTPKNISQSIWTDGLIDHILDLESLFS